MADNAGQRDMSFRSLGYTSLAALAAQGPDAVRMAIAAAGHPDVVHAMSEEVATSIRSTMTKEQISGKAPLQPAVTRGKIMFHKPSAQRVTIIRASMGKEKSGEVVHEVVTKKGKKFFAKDSNLKPLT